MDLRRILAKQFDKPALDVLIGCCQTLKLGAGTPLFRRGDPGDALYFIERGHVSVLLRLDDGQTKRLRAFGPGTIVGEMAIYSHQPRSADVVADTGCRVRKLSAQDLERLEREHPEVAVQFHRFVVRLLSARLAAANEEIRGLL
jgi:SulP family sulfate permease